MENIKLDLTIIQKNTYSDMRKEMLEEDIKSLPFIDKNKVSIDKVYVYKDDNSVEINTFIRNTTENAISFENIPLIVKKESGEIIAAKIFELDNLKDIQPNGARPCSFIFENRYVNDLNDRFENIILEQSYDMENFDNLKLNILSLPNHLTEEEIKSIRKKANVKKGLNNIIPIEFGTDSNEVPYLIVLINNGTAEETELPVIPLTIKDANNKKIISDRFNIDIKNIKPWSANAYTIMFTDKKLNIEEYDLSKFSIDFWIE